MLVSKEKEFNQERTSYQSFDFHFVVQSNDGAFSHRRGNAHHPEKVDSVGKPIFCPEQSKFFYTDKNKTAFDDETNSRVPICHDYEFIGYLYIKTLFERKFGIFSHVIEMLEDIEKNKNTNEQMKKTYDEFRKNFSIYPPLIQYFEDARNKIAECHFKFSVLESQILLDFIPQELGQIVTDYLKSHDSNYYKDELINTPKPR